MRSQLKRTINAASLVALLVGLLMAAGEICQAQVTGLYSFTGGNDGGRIAAGLHQASDGNLYGVARLGGANNCGTIFKFDLTGNFTLLHTFSGSSDGANPYTDLIQASDGVLYGTCFNGGAYGSGTIYKIDLTGNFTLVYTFTGGSDGAIPDASLIQANDGNLYGVARFGGSYSDGTIFKIDLTGNLSVLYSFTGGSDGAQPYGGLLQASDGNLYGSTRVGGAYGDGTIFRIVLAGNFTLLYTFTGGSDGAQPYASLMQASDGDLYGDCITGGNYGWGTIYKIDLAGNFTSLYSFTGGSDAGHPYERLMQASDGNLYGTSHGSSPPSYGTIFKIDLAGNFTTVYAFTNGSDGDYPGAGLIEATDGNLYGTTDGGPGNGTIYRYALPALSSLKPGQVKAYSTNVKLTLSGANFSSASAVYFGAAALTTTFVSGSQLTATIPANLLTTPGVVAVTVVQVGAVSNALGFTILPAPHLAASVDRLSRDASNNIVVPITVTNNGSATALNVQIKSPATLNNVGTSTTLPLSLGSLAVGSSQITTLVFPGSAGTTGSSVLLKVTISYQGGNLTLKQKVLLP